MAILTRTGKLIGQITSPATKNIDLRISQFNKYGDHGFRLAFAKKIVAGKIKNSLQVMRWFSYNHPDRDFKSERSAISTRLREVENITQIAQLFGIEGSAAKSYFEAFGNMLLCTLEFPGRRKHPSTDPVNALLSFGYTIIFNEISSLLDGLGFDPYLSYFHSIDYGRASLASDLMEEFRAPIVDRFTLYLVNNRIIGEADFYSNPKGGGVYLKREPLKRYFKEYEEMINRKFIHPETNVNSTWRKCFRIQAETLAAHIQDDKPYVPFELKA